MDEYFLPRCSESNDISAPYFVGLRYFQQLQLQDLAVTNTVGSSRGTLQCATDDFGRGCAAWNLLATGGTVVAVGYPNFFMTIFIWGRGPGLVTSPSFFFWRPKASP